MNFIKVVKKAINAYGEKIVKAQEYGIFMEQKKFGHKR